MERRDSGSSEAELIPSEPKQSRAQQSCDLGCLQRLETLKVADVLFQSYQIHLRTYMNPKGQWVLGFSTTDGMDVKHELPDDFAPLPSPELKDNPRDAEAASSPPRELQSMFERFDCEEIWTS